MTHSEDKLQRMTRNYWRLRREDLDESWNYYLVESKSIFGKPEPPLLEMEMAYAVEQRRVPPVHDNTTLVILVGESFEPLLQSIWAHQPRRLVAVINKHYGDSDASSDNHVPGELKWRELHKHISRLPVVQNGHLIDIPSATAVSTIADNPTAVFEFLRDHLRADLLNPEKHIVIDITGAKKTMVAGAFLLATYTRAEIYYIDTDVYHEGRPYGYACCFRKVANPLEHLSLYTWQQIEHRYNQYDFSGARELLDLLLQSSQLDSLSHLQNLRHFLNVCDQWENGQLDLAKEGAAELPSPLQERLPPTINKVGGYWPREGNGDELIIDFFRDGQAILLYAFDELCRVKRLAGLAPDDKISREATTRRDYQAAFTRAYALYETLLKAMVFALYEKGELRVQAENRDPLLTSQLEQQDKTLYLAGLDWILHGMFAREATLLLSEKHVGHITLSQNKRGSKKADLYWWQATVEYLPFPIEPWVTSKQDYRIFTQHLRMVRNRIIHTYYPATEELSQRAIALAEVHIENYKAKWVLWHTGFDPANLPQMSAFTVPPWESLKQVFELHFIPEQERRKGVL